MLHFCAPLLLAATLVPAVPAVPGTAPSEAPSLEGPVAFDPGSVDGALAWLAGQQRADGTLAGTDHAGEAMALLALIGAGHTQGAGPHKEVVARAVAHLEGAFAEGTGETPARGDALAAVALAEHYLLAGRPADRAPGLEAAVEHMALGARARDLDREVAFWSCLALVSAKGSGVEVDEKALATIRTRLPLGSTDGALSWSAEATCAASVFLHLVTGGDVDDARLTAAVERVLGTVARPVTDDPMLVYLGAVALFQVGGASWRSWNLGPLTRLGKHAGQDGGFAAAAGLPGGRVAATALGALALETRYRYAQVLDR